MLSKIVTKQENQIRVHSKWHQPGLGKPRLGFIEWVNSNVMLPFTLASEKIDLGETIRNFFLNANKPNLFSENVVSFQDTLLLCGLLLDLRGRLDKKYLIKLRKPSRTGNHPSLNDNNDNRHRGYFLQKNSLTEIWWWSQFRNKLFLMMAVSIFAVSSQRPKIRLQGRKISTFVFATNFENLGWIKPINAGLSKLLCQAQISDLWCFLWLLGYISLSFFLTHALTRTFSLSHESSHDTFL